MTSVSSYMILSGSVMEIYAVEGLISRHMREGWVPTGGVAVSGGSFYQAMMRPMVEVTGLHDHGTRWEAS